LENSHQKEEKEKLGIRSLSVVSLSSEKSVKTFIDLCLIKTLFTSNFLVRKILILHVFPVDIIEKSVIFYILSSVDRPKTLVRISLQQLGQQGFALR